MKIESSNFCPLIKAECLQLKCSWFIKLIGTDNNTGQPVEDWGCSIKWLPMLLVENSNQQRQTCSSVDALRSEVSQGNQNVALNNLLEKLGE